MQSTYLTWADYLILAVFLVISLAIGLYHALTGGRQKTTTEFIMANRALGVLPTAISLLVSFQSALMVLGMTSEMYAYGAQHMLMINVVCVIACIAVERIIVPWIYPLKLVSIFEYFELRFHSKAVRILGASIGVLSGIIYMGNAMYAPSVALQAVTGFPLSLSIPVMAVVSVTYTALGGMRAVIWTDVFQFGIMVTGMIAVLIKGSLVIEGEESVFTICEREGRLDWANWSFNPTERHTVWGYLFGFSFAWIYIYGLNQASSQRFCATTSLVKARITVLLNIPALIFLNGIACGTGLVVVAYYSYIGCDPLANKNVQNTNQLLPYFVTNIFSHAPGFAGLFLATLYGGALSSVSSSLSGSAANCWEDILKWKLDYLPEHRKALINRFLVVVFGLIATAISFLAAVVPGPMTQVSMTMFGAVAGPLFGLFVLGGVSRLPNWKGSLIGALFGVFINFWMSLGWLSLQKSHPILPAMSTDRCFLPGNYSTTAYTPTGDPQELEMIEEFTEFFTFQPRQQQLELVGIEKFYAVSYLWVTIIGMLVTLAGGLLASLLFRDEKIENAVEQRLLIPWHMCLTWSDSGRKSSTTDEGNHLEKDLESQEDNNNIKMIIRTDGGEDEAEPLQSGIHG